MWLVLLAQVAAAGLHPKPSREPLPAREVERSLVLPKGWTEITGILARDTAVDATTRWTGAAILRHGLARRHEVWLELPWHALTAASFDATGFGDAAFGWRIGLLDHEPPRRSLALDLRWEAASAKSAFGVGTPEAEVGLAGRAELGALAVGLRGAYVWRVPGIVAGAEVDPVDIVRVAVDARFQAGPLIAVGRPTLSQPGGLDLHVGGAIALTRAVEVAAGHDRPLIASASTDVEERHGRGWTTSLTVRF